MGAVGILLGAFILILAPFLVRLLLGEGFEPAVPLLRLFALLPPLVALSQLLGVQWMLPLEMDRQFNTIIISGGLLNILLAILLVPHWQHIGMTVAVILSEAFVTTAIYFYLKWSRLDPFMCVEKVNRATPEPVKSAVVFTPFIEGLDGHYPAGCGDHEFCTTSEVLQDS